MVFNFLILIKLFKLVKRAFYYIYHDNNNFKYLEVIFIFKINKQYFFISLIYLILPFL